MPESPEELYARVLDQVGPSGRLPMSPVQDSEIFPWELIDGQLVPRVLPPPVETEPARSGAGGQDCILCNNTGDGVRVWESWNFHLMRPAKPSGLPLVLWLNANDHVDFTELTDDQAAEWGQLSVWLTRIMSNFPNIGRVHVNRWGDGSEHCHAWFLARPERFPNIRGSMAVEWDDILPPAPQDVWLADVDAVVRKLANHAGRAVPTLH